jgi:hypothetical protein
MSKADPTWRKVIGDMPSWQDGGRVELIREDGSLAFGEIFVDDVIHDDGDEYPVLKLTLDDGKVASIFDFEFWRTGRS